MAAEMPGAAAATPARSTRATFTTTRTATACRSAPTRRRPSFEPDLQWSWTGATEPYSIVTISQASRPAPRSTSRDKMDRWIQARRIWNEHTYHVTNVREDGTIPQYEQPAWTRLNTFRTNAQINGAGVCTPVIL
jgi:hypothetical protein